MFHLNYTLREQVIPCRLQSRLVYPWSSSKTHNQFVLNCINSYTRWVHCVSAPKHLQQNYILIADMYIYIYIYALAQIWIPSWLLASFPLGKYIVTQHFFYISVNSSFIMSIQWQTVWTFLHTSMSWFVFGDDVSYQPLGPDLPPLATNSV